MPKRTKKHKKRTTKYYARPQYEPGEYEESRVMEQTAEKPEIQFMPYMEKEKPEKDERGFWQRRHEAKLARQAAVEKMNEGQDISYKNVRPFRDVFIRGKSTAILHKGDYSKEEKKRYEKTAYKLERNARMRSWFSKKGGAGYKAVMKGEGSGRLAKVGKYNPLRTAGRGAAEKVGRQKLRTGILHAGSAMGGLGSTLGAAGMSSFQPIQIFTMAWKRMSATLKWLIILVFLVVILFVPWGIFYYTGWAVGAAFMFLISLIYWVFASFFNAIAYVLVTAINAVASIIMGVIIWIVEFFMTVFMKPNYYNPNSRQYEYYWTAGHSLFDNSLLKYSDLATVPTLMVPITPKWQDWMNTILIVKIFELVPGAQALADAFGAIGDAMAMAFQDIVVHSPPWLVIFIGLLPVILIIGIFVAVYLKYRHEAQVM